MSRRRVRWSRPSGCASTFSHNKPISAEELEQVERMANEIVVQNSPVTTRLMSVDDAIAEGAMALFGEKYGDEVRVVSMGTGLHGAKANRPYSVELCGGTHVARHRRHRPGAHRLRKRGRGRRAPHRGADRRGRAATSRRAGPAAEGGCRDAQGRRRPMCRRASRRCSTSARKLERELTEARKKLALGGGAPAGATVRRDRDRRRRRLHRQGGHRRRAEGPEAARRRRQEERSAPASSSSSAPARTARRASSSASPTT